jgi:hypothetical protein
MQAMVTLAFMREGEEVWCRFLTERLDAAH